MTRTGFAAIAFLLALAAASAQAQQAPAQQAPAQDVIQAHPALWHVRNGRSEVTLLGSLHVLPANMEWLTPDILHAIVRADTFVFEVPTDAPSHDQLTSLIAAHGSLPGGQSLRALLPPDSQTDYDAAIAAAHLSPGVTDREQPWLVSLQLNLAETMNRNYFPDAGVDYVMMSWANEHGRQVRYLETIDQQFAMIAADNGGLQLDEFESDLKQSAEEEEKDELQPLVQAWSDGDIARLGGLIDGEFQSHAEARKRLLTDRNKAWATQIELMLRQGHNIFVTVGVAHLAGPDGVPALLRADGYAVEGP